MEGFYPSISAEPSGQVSTYDFLVRARGDIPNPQGSEYCVSPLESRTPNPTRGGFQKGRAHYFSLTTSEK